jgi:non-ribosomal peptide synthetase component E (peptide arylation enzyme)
MAHNLMLNTPGILSAGSVGANVSLADNGASPSGADETQATAGIEPAYAEIKDLTVPVPTF